MTAFELTLERDVVVAQDSEREKFTALFDAHGGALMGMLRRLCRNPHDADDVFQETSVRVWKSFASRPWLRSPKSWLLTIGYRAFLDSRKRHRPTEEYTDPPDQRSRSPAELAERAEDFDRVQSAIADLPEMIREVVVLHYVGGLSIGETALAMDLAEGTVKSRLNAALTKLRSALE
jgi:RNA polymerase sigma-70 factor (ECF subfamily)